ncbi:MAG: hypothetical protein IPG17_27410 [Sandaracinaceae bacterium]|nr:hypothetical protein [Sandaracinaceae bacterium]
MNSGTTTTSVPLRFRVVLEVDPDARMFRGGNWRGRRSYVRVEVPVAADELQHNPHFPAWLKASANALNAVFVVQKLRDAEQELDATLCVEVAQGMLGVVESFNSVYQAIRVSRSIATNAATARVETLGAVVRRAATVNTLLGIGMDTYAGYKVLMGHDEGAMNALRAGEAGRWMLYEVKGVLKLGSAAGAAAGLAATAAAEVGLLSSATASAFVSGPVGWGLIVLGVTVLVLDLAIVYEESQQGPLHTFEQAVNNAVSREFQEDVGLEALAPGADRPRAGQDCLTKVYLATLHDRLGRV